MNKPSVLSLVSYRVFPALMGGQKCVVDFYAHLYEHAKLVLVVSKDNQIDPKPPYPLESFLFNHWAGDFNLIYLFRLLKLIKKQQVEWLVVEHSYFGWLALLLRFFSGKKMVIRMHNIEGHRFRDMQRFWWWIYLAYEKWICKKADLLWFTASTDYQYAIQEWKISPTKCLTLFYGIEQTAPPSQADRLACRKALLDKHQLDPGTQLFLFNGTLDYVPNTDALRIIVRELIPRLAKQEIAFKIFICGNRISEEWQIELQGYPEIIFEGFVPEIADYFKGTDCFINPVTLGSGLKTKLVEALAHNLDIISVASSTMAIDAEYSGQKIQLIPDYHWDEFVAAMCQHVQRDATDTPASFYAAFNWQQIIQKAILSLQP